ncbi:photosystem II assembly protein Psb34 [Halomicronema sp. CCY15110]|uniref:photosystem II assembly protein Psb34 n=1 Tax=Halomicronema sp. CCY15110 TaxID=2767773 RepID=UPI001951B979|nr:ssl1498 family light-harvesting-like protein [Halomicronema sp. CCY15110]
MYTTQQDNGVLNAYAIETEAYLAEYPSAEQQQRYLRQGALASLLVTGLFLVALAVS